MTNYCKFCLYPEKKKTSNTTERNFTGRRLPHLRDPHLLALTVFGLLFVLFVLLLILLLVAAFLVACVLVAACCCRCFCCCLCLLLLLGPPTVEPPLLPPLQCLTFQNVNNFFYNQLRQHFPVSHRICTGRHSSSPPPPPTTLRAPTPLGLNSVFGFSAFGPLCSCCCVKNTPLPLLTFQNVNNN